MLNNNNAPTHLISYVNSDKPTLRESVFMFHEFDEIESMLDITMSSIFDTKKFF